MFHIMRSMNMTQSQRNIDVFYYSPTTKFHYIHITYLVITYFTFFNHFGYREHALSPFQQCCLYRLDKWINAATLFCKAIVVALIIIVLEIIYYSFFRSIIHYCLQIMQPANYSIVRIGIYIKIS